MRDPPPRRLKPTMIKMQEAQRGFTLIEVVVSTFILTVGILALLGTFLSGLALVESSRGTSTAAADARAVFEEMRRLSGNSLTQVTGRNWTVWSTQAGLSGLPNESVAVTYRNPAADPLEATVTVSWQDRGRNRSAVFTSLVTRR